MTKAQDMETAEAHVAAAAEELAKAQAEPDMEWAKEPVFDRSKPYGLHSDPFGPKKFHQNGHWFSNTGAYVKEQT